MIFICGINGFIPLNKDISTDKILEITKWLLTELSSRGRDATGIAAWDLEKNEILICKQADEAKDFIPNLTEEKIKAGYPEWSGKIDAIIGHNRAQTRGPSEDPENNHPMFGEKYCIVHNGMVHTMKELEGYTYKGKCDTEVLLSYFERFGIREAIPQIDGSAAVAIFSPEDKMFYLYKHTSPIVISFIPGYGLAFASTEAPLKKLGEILGVEKVYNIFNPQLMNDLDEGQLFSLNLETHAVSIETIKIEYKSYISYSKK